MQNYKGNYAAALAATALIVGGLSEENCSARRLLFARRHPARW